MDFRSPNGRKVGYSMSVDEIDKVLYTYSSFLKCISNMNGDSNGIVFCITKFLFFYAVTCLLNSDFDSQSSDSDRYGI